MKEMLLDRGFLFCTSRRRDKATTVFNCSITVRNYETNSNFIYCIDKSAL